MYGFSMRVRTELGVDLLLRPYRSEEAATMVAGMQRYSVGRTLSQARAQTLEDEQAWLARQRETAEEVGWAICLAESDRPIGSIGLSKLVNRRGEAGLVIFDPEYWGKGVAQAASRAMVLYMVEVEDILAVDAGVMAVNAASYRLQLSVGFVLNGRIPQATYLDGAPCDLLRLTWVNPSAEAWRYFWRGQRDPQGLDEPYVAGRKRARAALAWARRNVELL